MALTTSRFGPQQDPDACLLKHVNCLEILEAEFEDRGERRACRCWSLPSAESDDPATLVGPGRERQHSTD